MLNSKRDFGPYKNLSKMRFHLFPLTLTSFLFFTSSLASSSDILYIQKLTADFAITLDTKNFTNYDVQFIPTATYDPGNGEITTGISGIKELLALVVGNVTTHTSLTTQSISVGPPAGTASATTYAIVSNLGQGADEGKAFTVYGIFKDKYVKTDDFANYGGWKYSASVFRGIVSFLPAITILCVHFFLLFWAFT